MKGEKPSNLNDLLKDFKVEVRELRRLMSKMVMSPWWKKLTSATGVGKPESNQSRMSDQELLDRAKRRKHQISPPQHPEGSKRPVFPSTPTPVMTDVAMYSATFPADFLAAEGTCNGIWPAAEKLLFPAAKQRLQAFDTPSVIADGVQLQLQALQNLLVSRTYVSVMEQNEKALKDKAKEAEEAVEGYKKKLQEAWERHEAEVEDLKKRLADEEEAKKRKEDEVELLKRKVHDLTEEVKDTEAFYTVKIRAKMANKYLTKKLTEQVAHAYVDAYTGSIGSLKDLESEEAKDAGEAGMSTADSLPKDGVGDVVARERSYCRKRRQCRRRANDVAA